MKRMRTAFLAAALLCSASAQAALLQEFIKGATSRSVEITILDAITGVPTAGLAFNSSGIDLEYCREATACTDITEVTQTVGGAWTSGGFVSKGHGVYRLDVPDAALATGVNSVNIQGTITGYIVVGGTIKLVNYNAEDVVRLGLTALPNVVSGSTGAIPVIDANGNVQADVEAVDDDATSASGTVTFPNATLASTTNITAGTITTVTTVNGLAANVITDAASATDFEARLTTQAASALTTYDPPTRAELTADKLEIMSMLGQREAITVTDQDTFTLANGPDRDDAFNPWAVMLLDTSNAGETDLVRVRDYVGSSKTVELERTAAFSIATGDIAVFLPAFTDDPVDTAFVNCTVNTANFAGSTTTLACILTDKEGAAVTVASGDLTGLELVITSGAQAYEHRYVFSTTWDGANSELQITLDRALPATVADAVTAIIR
jgi:hypothetical protein